MKNRPSLEEIFSGSQQTDTQATVDNRPPLEEIFSSPQSDNSMMLILYCQKNKKNRQ